MAQLIGILSTPTVQIEPFSGDVMQYPLFRRQFEDNVERMVSDPSRRLTQLLALYKGEANRVVAPCALASSSAEGYARARELLEARYGGDSWLVLEWVKRITSTKYTTLQTFSDELSAFRGSSGYERSQ